MSEEEEQEINIEDLEIIEDDEIVEEPSEQEVAYYAQYLGFDVLKHQKLAFSLAYKAIKTPLPRHYKRAILREQPDALYYINFNEGSISPFSPIEQLVIDEYCNEVDRANAKGKKPTQGAKPTNEKKKKRNVFDDSDDEDEEQVKPIARRAEDDEDEESQVARRIQQTKNKQMKEESLENLNVYDEDRRTARSQGKENLVNEVFTPNRQDAERINEELKKKREEDEEIDDEDIDKYIGGYTDEDERLEVSLDQENYKEADKVINTSQINEYEENKAVNIEDSIQEDIQVEQAEVIQESDRPVLKTETEGNKAVMGNTQKSKQAQDKPLEGSLGQGVDLNRNYEAELQRLKKEENAKREREVILNSLMDDLGKFENSLRDQQTQSQDALRKAHRDFQAQNDYKLKDLNSRNSKRLSDLKLSKRLENKDRLKQEIDNIHQQGEKAKSQKSNYQDQSIKDLKEQIKDLKRDKEMLLQIHKTDQNSDYAKYHEDLQAAKEILEEKFALSKKNLDGRMRQLEAEVQAEEEVKFTREIEAIKQDLEFRQRFQDEQFQNSSAKILDEYQKALDEEFDIQTKAIVKDLESNAKLNVERYDYSNRKDNENSMHLYSKEINDMERNYFQEMAFLREDHRQRNTARDKLLMSKFDTVLSTYEKLKNGLVFNTEAFLFELGNEFSRLSDGFTERSKAREVNSSVLSKGDLVEEFIMRKYDEFSIKSQKKKTNYELLEVDFKSIYTDLEYFVAEGSYMVQFIKDNNIIDSRENLNSFLVNQILESTREIQAEHKKKAREISSSPLYEAIKPDTLNALIINRTRAVSPSVNSLRGSTSQINPREDSKRSNTKDITSNRYNENQDHQSIYDEQINRGSIDLPVQEKPYISEDHLKRKSQIFDFIFHESSEVEKLMLDFQRESTSHENLKRSIFGSSMQTKDRSFGSFGMSIRPSSSNERYFSYIDILEEDKQKLRSKEKALNDRMERFLEIKRSVDDLFDDRDKVYYFVRVNQLEDLMDSIERKIQAYKDFLSKSIPIGIKSEEKLDRSDDRDCIGKRTIQNIYDGMNSGSSSYFQIYSSKVNRLSDDFAKYYDGKNLEGNIERIKRSLDRKIADWKRLKNY